MTQRGEDKRGLLDGKSNIIRLTSLGLICHIQPNLHRNCVAWKNPPVSAPGSTAGGSREPSGAFSCWSEGEISHQGFWGCRHASDVRRSVAVCLVCKQPAVCDTHTHTHTHSRRLLRRTTSSSIALRNGQEMMKAEQTVGRLLPTRKDGFVVARLM